MAQTESLWKRIVNPGAVILLGLLWALTVTLLLKSGSGAIQDAEENASKASVANSAEDDNPCQVIDPPAAGQDPADPAADPARATLTLQENASTTVAFGRGTGQLEREFEYAIADPDEMLAGADCLLVELGPFTRDTGDAQLERARISARAAVLGDRALIVVNFDRTAAALGDPGSYSGVVRIADPRVERTDITMLITMAYPFWQLPLAAFIGLLFPAIVYLWLLKGSFGSSKALSIRQFQTYVFSRNGILAVGAGTVAAVGIYSATYLSGSTWGSSPGQVLTLIGAAFAAFATAATAVAAAGADSTEAVGQAIADALAKNGVETNGSEPKPSTGPDLAEPGAPAVVATSAGQTGQFELATQQGGATPPTNNTSNGSSSHPTGTEQSEIL